MFIFGLFGVHFIFPLTHADFLTFISPYQSPIRWRMRIDAWFSMSLFFLRNIVVMSRQTEGERFLLIKSAIKLELVALERGAFGDDSDDESNGSHGSSASNSAIVAIAPFSAHHDQAIATVSSTDQTREENAGTLELCVTSVSEQSRCVTPESVGCRAQRTSRISIGESPVFAAACAALDASPSSLVGRAMSGAQPEDSSPGQPHQPSSPSPASRNGWLSTTLASTDSQLVNPVPIDSTVDGDGRESLLEVASAFGNELDSSLRPHEPMLGICMERVWTSSGFATFSVLSLASCLALVSLRQPTTYLMLAICYADVILITICGSALIDMRILRCLARTFEFWFLQTVMFIGFSVALYELSLMSDQMAAFEGTDPTIYLYGDVLWQCAGFIGSVVVVCFDALMVSRNVKLAFNVVWICNALRLFYQLLFDYSTRAYAYPITVRFAWESFCIQTIRVEVWRVNLCFALLVYSHVCLNANSDLFDLLVNGRMYRTTCSIPILQCVLDVIVLLCCTLRCA